MIAIQVFIISLALFSLSHGDNTDEVTKKISTVSLATHPPWPILSTYLHTSKSYTYPHWPTRSSHTTYPSNLIQRATHPPYPPIKKTTNSHSDKKSLLKLDTILMKTWFKEALAYIAAPLFMPSAITKAIKPPPGLSSPGRSLWSKMIASFRSVILKRSSPSGSTLLSPSLSSSHSSISTSTSSSSLSSSSSSFVSSSPYFSSSSSSLPSEEKSNVKENISKVSLVNEMKKFSHRLKSSNWLQKLNKTKVERKSIEKTHRSIN